MKEKNIYDYGLKRVASYYDFINKDRNVRYYTDMMLSRTQQMFKYNNLPNTIPQLYLEKFLQRNGNCCIAEHEGNLYAFVGGLGGYPDVYYMPTTYIVANPYLKLTKEYKIGLDCVFIRNDSEMLGLLPICEKYSSLLVEADITLRNTLINMRTPYIASIHGDNQKAAFDRFIQKIEKGYLSEAVTDSFDESFKTSPFTINDSTILNLVEAYQYIKGNWYNDLGIKAAFNMKREALNKEEVRSNDESLFPFCDNMLQMRRNAMDEVNQMFGTNISVDYDSSWLNVMNDRELELKMFESEITQVQAETEEIQTETEEIQLNVSQLNSGSGDNIDDRSSNTSE